MNYEKLKQYEKFEVLKQAVMRDSPHDVADMLKAFGELEFTAMALGLACRYRGLDMVKALIENGAKFTYSLYLIKPLYRRANQDTDITYEDENYAAALLNSVGLVEMHRVYQAGKAYNRPMLPINDRLRILSYLCKTAEQTGFDGDELLFYAYFSGDREIIDFLKKHGKVIPEKWIKIVTEGSTDDKWLNYCYLVERLSDENFLPFMTALIKEIGGRKLHMTERMWEVNKKRLDTPGFMKLLLENYNLSKMNKGNLMKEIILRDDADSLEIAADRGWLKQPKKRDEMIAFAAEKNKTECTAWLLDFKNRTADLAAERARAEKKAERELNAAPDSVTALKQLWNYKKRDDGSVIITGYKGDRTKIVVPAKIGKGEVKAIGKNAFSPYGARLTSEAKAFRETITEITLPESVREIGEGAFFGCIGLRSVNIPEGVSEIADNTFNNCVKLEKINIPSSVRAIGSRAFLKCETLETIIIPEGVTEIVCSAFHLCSSLKTIELPRSLTSVITVKYSNGSIVYYDFDAAAIVPRESYAEKYCKELGINFIYCSPN